MVYVIVNWWVVKKKKRSKIHIAERRRGLYSESPTNFTLCGQSLGPKAQMQVIEGREQIEDPHGEDQMCKRCERIYMKRMGKP